MGEIVNLRLARKAATRRSKEAEAAANRAAHGRTSAERDATKAENVRAARLLDGAKRDSHD
ncbi:hypothetical protein NSE01_07480 [Novosphingobium sediminis]|uniref:DUF4169 domain-containing protein n=1 Tax=Novosphingobium sediminis TaxID=707214 RepID=A0A512AGS5_9SPHN|nr:DUF4169 family protein [Novosphingobium sediminis]GEN98915.1 hypothetical protein NSE01_07480 [Novosphingobium sediminis]